VEAKKLLKTKKNRSQYSLLEDPYFDLNFDYCLLLALIILGAFKPNLVLLPYFFAQGHTLIKYDI
jgi:hypothetical protein